MKLKFFQLFLILFAAVGCFAQTQPTSKLFNAKQLLNDLQFLSTDEMNGRFVGTPESKQAREFIVKRFKDSKIQPFGTSFLHQFEFSRRQNPAEKITGINVAGFIKGKQNPNKYIVVTAHYDHVPRENGQIMNGANDNASGTAALFAAGKFFSKNRPNNSIIFVALDAEEVGLVGARKFVEKPPVAKESMILNINMDMICRDKSEILYAVGTYHYPFLKPILEKVAATSKSKLLLGHDNPNLKEIEDWTFSSDHAAFHREKIPFIYFGVEDFANHHKPTDDFATIQPKFYVQNVETVIDSIREFDKNSSEIERQTAK
jgi:Zn-dependent M28 family amino/carboxypeptidase